jgi:predicted hotdog family 3-hydroxylacyl-ACP dehydratase
MNNEDQDLIRKRQRSRALVMGVLLGALVLLIFAISIAKIQLGMNK